MKTKLLLIGIIVVGIAVLSIIFFPLFTSNDPSPSDKGFFQEIFDSNVPNEQQNTYENNQENSMGGGGGSSGGSSSGLSPGCQQQAQISYSVQNLQTHEVCNQNSSETCINKSITCSADIYNFDDTTSGVFAVRFFVIEQGGSTDNYFANATVESTVESDNNATLSYEFAFQDENAAKDLACIYRTEFVPKKCA